MSAEKTMKYYRPAKKRRDIGNQSVIGIENRRKTRRRRSGTAAASSINLAAASAKIDISASAKTRACGVKTSKNDIAARGRVTSARKINQTLAERRAGRRVMAKIKRAGIMARSLRGIALAAASGALKPYQPSCWHAAAHGGSSIIGVASARQKGIAAA
jgi:hypothetical protein